ncbi:hypothetical protein ACWEJ6_21055 [Nonomuraea sp. NPDC004702]
MDILLLLTLVAFLAGGVVSAIQKAWVMVLLFSGLALWVLSETDLIHS